MEMMRFRDGYKNNLKKRKKQKRYKNSFDKKTDIVIKNTSYPDQYNFYCYLNTKFIGCDGRVHTVKKSKGYKKSEYTSERRLRRKLNHSMFDEDMSHMKKCTYDKLRYPDGWRMW